MYVCIMYIVDYGLYFVGVLVGVDMEYVLMFIRCIREYGIGGGNDSVGLYIVCMYNVDYGLWIVFRL